MMVIAFVSKLSYGSEMFTTGIRVKPAYRLVLGWSRVRFFPFFSHFHIKQCKTKPIRGQTLDFSQHSMLRTECPLPREDKNVSETMRFSVAGNGITC